MSLNPTSRIKKFVHALDTVQQRHAVLGFPYAVFRKYNDDQAGNQAAFLTYYAFLSLFPLLLILTTVVSLLSAHHSVLQQDVVTSVTNYFPVLGGQLSTHVHTLHKSGLALLTGILFALYGARGVANVFREGVHQVWLGTPAKSDNYPKSVVRSIALILVGGAGFILASVVAGYAAAVGHGFGFRVLSIAVNFVILFVLFSFLLNMSLPSHVSFKETRVGAAVAAIGLVILQGFGSYLLTRELKNLDALYSTFAIALGLLFWIYLQAQVLYYAIEIATVHSRKLWPRAIDSARPTAADQKIKGQTA